MDASFGATFTPRGSNAPGSDALASKRVGDRRSPLRIRWVRRRRSTNQGSSRALYIEAVDQLLIAQIESSVDDDRVRPNASLRTPFGAQRRQFEATQLLPSLSTRLHQSDIPIALIEANELSIGVGDRSLPKTLVGPDFFAGFQFLADPTAPVGVAVKVSIDANNPAMVVLHHLVGVKWSD